MPRLIGGPQPWDAYLSRETEHNVSVVRRIRQVVFDDEGGGGIASGERSGLPLVEHRTVKFALAEPGVRDSGKTQRKALLRLLKLHKGQAGLRHQFATLVRLSRSP